MGTFTPTPPPNDCDIGGTIAEIDEKHHCITYEVNVHFDTTYMYLYIYIIYNAEFRKFETLNVKNIENAKQLLSQAKIK